MKLDLALSIWQLVDISLWTCGGGHNLPKEHGTIIGKVWEWNSYLSGSETPGLFSFPDLKMRSIAWVWNNLQTSSCQNRADILHLEAFSLAWKSGRIHDRVYDECLGILHSFIWDFNTLNIILLIFSKFYGYVIFGNFWQCI